MWVRNQKQLLDEALKHFHIQYAGAKDNDAISVNEWVVAAPQILGGLLLAVQYQGDVLLMHTDGHAVPLAVRQVDAREEWVALGPRLPRVVLVEEDGRAAQLQAQLLDALLIVQGDQEGLAALLGFHSGENGKVLGEWRVGVQLLRGCAELGILGHPVGHIRASGRPPSRTEASGLGDPFR